MARNSLQRYRINPKPRIKLIVGSQSLLDWRLRNLHTRAFDLSIPENYRYPRNLFTPRTKPELMIFPVDIPLVSSRCGFRDLFNEYLFSGLALFPLSFSHLANSILIENHTSDDFIRATRPYAKAIESWVPDYGERDILEKVSSFFFDRKVERIFIDTLYSDHTTVISPESASSFFAKFVINPSPGLARIDINVPFSSAALQEIIRILKNHPAKANVVYLTRFVCPQDQAKWNQFVNKSRRAARSRCVLQ